MLAHASVYSSTAESSAHGACGMAAIHSLAVLSQSLHSFITLPLAEQDALMMLIRLHVVVCLSR